MKKRYSASLLVLLLELLLTLGAGCIFLAVNISAVRIEDRQYTAQVEADYANLMDGYTSVFKALTIQVREKIAEEPDFAEMQRWLQERDTLFADAVGEKIYDGFAMTYQGGYAHSWDYGDYSQYVPESRPWYRQAQKAQGRVTIVAPYVTYLDPSYIESDQYIELTIAQKYSDDISFDLDLKISGINALLAERYTTYSSATAVLCNPDGYILSTTDAALYCHNIHTPDAALSEGLHQGLEALLRQPGTLLPLRIDGRLMLCYAATDGSGNTCCIFTPFWDVFVHNSLPVVLIVCLLIFIELAIFFRNRSVIAAMAERERLITEIGRTGFERQVFVDIETMKCLRDASTRHMLPSEDYPTSYRMLLHAVDTEDGRRELDAMLSPEALRSFAGKDLTKRQFEFDMPRKDGTRVHMILEFSLFLSTINGRATAVILGNNVTARQEALLRTMQSIAYHYLSAFSGRIGRDTYEIIKAGPGYSSVAVSRSFFALQRRYAAEQVRPEDADAFLDAVDPSTIQRRLAGVPGYSLTFGLRDGHWQTLTIIRSEEYQETRGFVFLLESADEQMRQQQALQQALDKANQAARVQSDFLSRMSHDIRTPMNGIIGMTRLARQQENPPKTADCLAKIDLSSRYLLGLINDILDMNRIENGELHLQPEPYPVPELSAYLEAVIRPLCESRRQQFLVEMETPDCCVPTLDKLRFNQIVFNLLSNAVKYTQVGGTIRFALQGRPAGDGMELTLRVRDNGRGMSPAFQRVLFDAYTQEDRVRTMDTAAGSSGLGLSIVKKIVDLMHGTIRVESAENQGSTFTVTLQAGCAHVDAATERARRAARDRSRLAGRRALLCEDNRINQEIAQALLEQAQIHADLAENGAVGLQMLDQVPAGYYDWILMDLRMPILDGYETTRAIRAMKRGDAGTIPIVAMTADAFEEDIRRCREAGMNGHVAKPLDPQKIYETLAELLPEDPV